ncbi:MAG: hypothetical protein FD121_761 [Gallionellaceae bacterium]|nr:MAG: hypothetical protein FD121_761 [Gallionellaceae bacterium]
MKPCKIYEGAHFTGLSLLRHPAQQQLLGTSERLDFALPLQRRGLVDASLLIDQFQWRPSTRVFGALASIMRSEAFIQVIGDAAVEGVVGALEEVAAPTHLFRNFQAITSIKVARNNIAALPQRT